RTPVSERSPVGRSRPGRGACRSWRSWWRWSRVSCRRPSRSQGTLVARPGDVRLVQGDGDLRDALGALAERALVDAFGEPVGDDLGQVLRGGVDSREVRFVVEVAVVQLADDGAEFLCGQADVDDDVVLVQLF